MVDNAVLEKVIKEVMQSMQTSTGKTTQSKASCGSECSSDKMTRKDYPLSETRVNEIKTPTGKSLSDITIENIMSGNITAEDVKIAPETLEYQAQIAESVGRNAFAMNLRRAAELISVPDDRILEIYNALRPYRSTKAELLAIADELENKYGCKINSNHVREAADVYERRGRLKE
ncbi:diol dehydratase small subunit [Fusibacter ferrireducens]|uniref:Diol dehydratase small subunit n=1 Tax=Fusibacter ferrireducens TaxID=2785058 RepID=A0ABR9ZZX9_9FIRM|nr:diol dehydratase small subunit [Fusibacter ferrireducens]MBF4695931.1 diol dehydratase small subunit [Fusibacter ferrireducens]